MLIPIDAGYLPLVAPYTGICMLSPVLFLMTRKAAANPVDVTYHDYESLRAHLWETHERALHFEEHSCWIYKVGSEGKKRKEGARTWRFASKADNHELASLNVIRVILHSQTILPPGEWLFFFIACHTSSS